MTQFTQSSYDLLQQFHILIVYNCKLDKNKNFYIFVLVIPSSSLSRG